MTNPLAADMLSLGTKYDLINTALFLPTGGSGHLRQRLVDELDIKPGQRVLELGCGTGQVTERLLDAGARVVAVDALSAMLDAARRRAPAATFLLSDALAADVENGFDHVVISFVLHNFDTDGRRRMLEKAAGALRDGGTIGILEWALPGQTNLASLWRRFLHRLEPSPSVSDILDGALEDDLAAAMFAPVKRRSTAGGRAQIIVARKAS